MITIDKKKGFTLAELLISMSLLSFIILMATTLFDRAIHVSPKLKKNITDTSQAYSKIENSIIKARRDFDSIPSSTTFSNINIKVGGIEVKNVEGHLISYHNNNIHYDKAVEKDHKWITFVGKGHVPSETSKIKKIYLANDGTQRRFRLFPINKSQMNIVGHYQAENNPILQKMRTRFYGSLIDSNGILYTTYSDPYDYASGVKYSGINVPDIGGFGIESAALDGPDKAHSLSNTLTKKGYKKDKSEYLNSIDRSYITSAMTLNRNGHVSPTVYSLNNNDKFQQNAVHLIGLPLDQNLAAFYDYNLLVTKSRTNENNYYTLYNPYAADDTSFPYSGSNSIISETGGHYTLDWKKLDVRHLTGLITDVVSKPSAITMSKGIFPKVDIQPLDPSFPAKPFPYAQKSYGGTVYHDGKSRIAEFQVPNGGKYTFFVKFNNRNYNNEFLNKNASAPIALLSSNWDLNTGTQGTGGSGFVIYADHEGNLFKNESNKSLNPKINDNLNNNKLYENPSTGSSVYELLKRNDKLPYLDGRHHFQIMAFSISRASNTLDVEAFMLATKTENVKIGGKDTNTVITIPKSIGRWSFHGVPENKAIFFGGNIKKGSNASASGTHDITDPLNGNGMIEISDMILYNSDLKSIPFGKGNYLTLTMEYLYRKYLTKKEREAGYDIYYTTKY